MSILSKFIKAVMLAEMNRSLQTVNGEPNTFSSFSDYEIQINPINGERYSVLVFLRERKISNMATFRNYEEAMHHARMVIDNHRVSFMNK